MGPTVFQLAYLDMQNLKRSHRRESNLRGLSYKESAKANICYGGRKFELHQKIIASAWPSSMPLSRICDVVIHVTTELSIGYVRYGI